MELPFFSHAGDAFDHGWGGGGGAGGPSDRPHLPPGPPQGPPLPRGGPGGGQPSGPGGPPNGRDNWYRDDWFNKQEQWQQHDTYRNSYQYHNEADDR